MTPILENAALGTDLDCQNRDILNIRHMYPVPPGLVDLKDSRLHDPRVPPIGSVTNEHVAAPAGIVQSKLSLNGQIPAAWMVGPIGEQPEFPYAAQGNLAELVSRKGAINGYAGLNANGKLASVNVNTGAATGTVSHVGLDMPSQFSVAGSPIATSGIFSVSWNDAPASSWFGVSGPVDLDHPTAIAFITSQLPEGLIPSLDATKFTTGTFTVERLPAAIGMGVDHASGVVPDTGKTGSIGDYLGRDMKWHHFDADKSYQPAVPKPNIIFAAAKEPSEELAGTITIRPMVAASIIFYKVDNAEASPISPPFTEVHPAGESVTFDITTADTVYAYAAKAGYNNSEINSFSPAALIFEIPAEPPPV